MIDNSKTSFGRLMAMTLIGTGLVAIGIMFMLLLYNKNEAAASTSDFSVVPVEVEFAAPNLNLQTLAGEPVSLSKYRGSVVLVNLWATWCPPCREEMPALLKFYEAYKSDGFVLVAINQEESPDIVKAFVDDYGLTFPVWLDENYIAQQEFKTMNLPSSYVIDRNGQVRLMWIGGISQKNLEKYVSEIIKE